MKAKAVHNSGKADIVLALILGPRRTSEGFSPDEDRDKRSRSNTMSALLGSRYAILFLNFLT
jgi:hypothetical protein